MDRYLGSGALNPGAVFLRFFTLAFLLFLTTAGGSNPSGQLPLPNIFYPKVTYQKLLLKCEETQYATKPTRSEELILVSTSSDPVYKIILFA